MRYRIHRHSSPVSLSFNASPLAGATKNKFIKVLVIENLDDFLFTVLNVSLREIWAGLVSCRVYAKESVMHMNPSVTNNSLSV